MTDAEPLYVYKLVPSSSPVREPLPDRLPVSDIDRSSGYIHLSTAFQVPNTVKAFYNDEPLVYVLRIPYTRIAAETVWESPEGNVCGPRPKEGLFPVCHFFLTFLYFTFLFFFFFSASSIYLC